MGYEVRQYKLTQADAAMINSGRQPNWFHQVKEGDEYPMIVMGKVLLDGDSVHWVNPSALPSAPVAEAAKVDAAPASSMASPTPSVAASTASAPSQVKPVAPSQVSPVTPPTPPPPSPVALTAEQHAALQAAGVPVTK